MNSKTIQTWRFDDVRIARWPERWWAVGADMVLKEGCI